MALRQCLACSPAQLAKRVVFHCFKEVLTRTTVIGHPLREARVRCSARRGFGQFGGYSNPGSGKYLRHLAWESLKAARWFSPSEGALPIRCFRLFGNFGNRVNFFASYSVTRVPARMRSGPRNPQHV